MKPPIKKAIRRSMENHTHTTKIRQHADQALKPDQLMQQALAAFQKGDTSIAHGLCELLIKAKPDHAGALNLLGVMAAQQQDVARAAELFALAAAADPADALVRGNLANMLHVLRRLDDAVEVYNQALALQPDYADAYYNRGNILHELGRLDEALSSYARAIECRPSYAEAYYNFANILFQTARLEDALSSYDLAILVRPAYAEAYYNRGNTLHQIGRREEALGSYQSALSVRANYPEAWLNSGNIHHELRQFDAALACYAQAIAQKPDYAEAYCNQGNVLHDLKRFDQAMSSYGEALRLDPAYAGAYCNCANTQQELKLFDQAMASCARALSLRPSYAEAHSNMGNVLQELGRLDEALTHYSQAIQLRPSYAEAYRNRASTLQDMGRLDEALADYGTALRLKPDFEFLPGIFLHAKMQLCDWTDAAFECAALLEQVQQGKRISKPFAILGLTDSPALQRQAAEIWAEAQYPESDDLPPVWLRTAQKRIRIAYYSADFHNHATAYLMAELLEKHDRSRFELIAFSFGRDSQDEMRLRVSAAFDQFIDVRHQSDREIALLSREMEIAIAVDLKGYTQYGRPGIFSYRAAPVQVNYLGYPGTMAAGYMDYLIADERLIPLENRPYYAEKIVYLPDSYQPNDRHKLIADQRYTREEFGLPASGFVFCCFNNNYKITPATFACWMRILKKVDGSVLWLLEDNPTAARNLQREAQALGVNAERLVFAKRLPLAEHLARHRLADLFLDTLPCNAHTTASDALWAGLPLLTCKGEAFASRVAASLLHALELEELITTSMDSYETMAIELAGQPQMLAGLRHRLEVSRVSKPLFDTQRYVGHLEAAYMQIHTRYLSGLTPDDIYISQ